MTGAAGTSYPPILDPDALRRRLEYLAKMLSLPSLDPSVRAVLQGEMDVRTCGVRA